MTGPKFIHHLIQVNYERRTAVCSICGPTKISVYRHKKYNYLNRRCINASLQDASRAKRRRHGVRMGLINQYKLRQGCKQCGYRSPDPTQFRFFEIHIPRKEKIAILAWDGARHRLLQEVEKRDVYCRKCYRRLRREVLLTSRENT